MARARVAGNDRCSGYRGAVPLINAGHAKGGIMNGWSSSVIAFALAGVAACGGASGNDPEHAGNVAEQVVEHPRGSASNMPAFYDCNPITINFAELPAGGERATLAHNGSLNVIFMCDQCEAAGFEFVSVIDA